MINTSALIADRRNTPTLIVTFFPYAPLCFSACCVFLWPRRMCFVASSGIPFGRVLAREMFYRPYRMLWRGPLVVFVSRLYFVLDIVQVYRLRQLWGVTLRNHIALCLWWCEVRRQVFASVSMARLRMSFALDILVYVSYKHLFPLYSYMWNMAPSTHSSGISSPCFIWFVVLYMVLLGVYVSL